MVAKGDDAGTGQGRHVDHGLGIVAVHIGEGIAQHQAAFGVGVEHLDGLAGHGSEDVTGAVGVAPGMFSQPASTPMTLMGSCNWARACMVPSTEAAPPMSYFISSMPSAGFDGDAAGVEGQPLAHQHDGLGVGVALVLDDGHHGFVLGAAGHCEVGVHAELGHLLLPTTLVVMLS